MSNELFEELINFYISKSKKEQNSEALFYAYRYASMASNYPQNIKYADTALVTTSKSKVKKILLDAYLNRGNINMSEEFYEKALDDILVANKLSQEYGNDYIFHKTIYIIAQNKMADLDKDFGIELFKLEEKFTDVNQKIELFPYDSPWCKVNGIEKRR